MKGRCWPKRELLYLFLMPMLQQFFSSVFRNTEGASVFKNDLPAATFDVFFDAVNVYDMGMMYSAEAGVG